MYQLAVNYKIMGIKYFYRCKVEWVSFSCTHDRALGQWKKTLDITEKLLTLVNFWKDLGFSLQFTEGSSRNSSSWCPFCKTCFPLLTLHSLVQEPHHSVRKLTTEIVLFCRNIGNGSAKVYQKCLIYIAQVAVHVPVQCSDVC